MPDKATPLFTRAVTPAKPSELRSEYQVGRNIKLSPEMHGGTSWGARIRMEAFTLDGTFLGGIADHSAGVGGPDWTTTYVQTCRDLWPEHF